MLPDFVAGRRGGAFLDPQIEIMATICEWRRNAEIRGFRVSIRRFALLAARLLIRDAEGNAERRRRELDLCDAASNDLNCEALGLADRLVPPLAVTHYAWQFDRLRDPASVFLSIEVDRRIHSPSVHTPCQRTVAPQIGLPTIKGAILTDRRQANWGFRFRDGRVASYSPTDLDGSVCETSERIELNAPGPECLRTLVGFVTTL
jgi:hypothetical protein